MKKKCKFMPFFPNFFLISFTHSSYNYFYGLCSYKEVRELHNHHQNSSLPCKNLISRMKNDL